MGIPSNTPSRSVTEPLTHHDHARPMDPKPSSGRRKLNWDSIGHAFPIGFLVGIAVFATASKNFGFALLLPLYLAWSFLRKGKRSEDSGQARETLH